MWRTARPAVAGRGQEAGGCGALPGLQWPAGDRRQVGVAHCQACSGRQGTGGRWVWHTARLAVAGRGQEAGGCGALPGLQWPAGDRRQVGVAHC